MIPVMLPSMLSQEIIEVYWVCCCHIICKETYMFNSNVSFSNVYEQCINKIRTKTWVSLDFSVSFDSMWISHHRVLPSYTNEPFSVFCTSDPDYLIMQIRYTTRNIKRRTQRVMEDVHHKHGQDTGLPRVRPPFWFLQESCTFPQCQEQSSSTWRRRLHDSF